MRIVTDAAFLILDAVLVLLWWWVSRYNIHMFQLNTYRPTEQAAWFRTAWKKQSSLIILAVLAVLSVYVPVLPLLVVTILWGLFLIRYFHFLKRYNNRKKLVFTMRVRRLITTDGILTAVLTVLLMVLFMQALPDGIGGTLRAMAGSLSLVIFLTPARIILSNTVNRPVELLVNQHFINDAKRKLRAHPDLRIIGITGSYGKTSVKYDLETILSAKYNVLITPGNYNTPMGIVKTVRQSLKNSDQIFLCEMGARHVGDISECCTIAHPDLGVITAVGPQHLDTFHSIENVSRTKFELADAVPAGNPVFVNFDSDYARRQAAGRENIVPYAVEHDAPNGYKATDVAVSLQGTAFTVHAPDGTAERFETRLIGAHNVINLLGAIAVGHTLGIALQDMRIPVRRIRPVAHRMEMRNEGSDVTIIDDAYNSNPVGSRAAVSTLGMFDGVRILVTPGMIELGDAQYDYNYKFGTYAAASCDYIVTVNRVNRDAIRQGALDSGFPESHLQSFLRLEDAMRYVRQIRDRGHKYILLENDLPDNF